jgi:hypothetical protein
MEQGLLKPLEGMNDWIAKTSGSNEWTEDSRDLLKK